jgi:recombination protein RecA
VCALFLNQTREKIGIMFGDSVATFGGKAVGFYASIRIELKISNKIKVGKKIVGIMARAYVTKNKVAMPFKHCTLPIYFGHGIDDALASFYFMKEANLLEGHNWYTIPALPNVKKFQKTGWEKVYDEHFQEIADLIMTSETEDEEETKDEDEDTESEENNE